MPVLGAGPLSLAEASLALLGILRDETTVVIVGSSVVMTGSTAVVLFGRRAGGDRD